MRGPASTRVAAVQSWPAFKYPAMAMFSAASSRSASSKTITGALPPSSRWTFLTSSAAALATAMPAPTLPVMETICGVGCRRPLPHGHHRWVVPRRDRRADADGLAPDERGEALHVLPGRAALEHARRAREEADLVDHRRDLLRQRERLRLAGVA